MLLDPDLEDESRLAVLFEAVPSVPSAGRAICSHSGQRGRQLVPALEAWLIERPPSTAPGETALFVAYHGARMTPRAIDLVIRSAGADAGILLSAQVLRPRSQ